MQSVSFIYKHQTLSIYESTKHLNLITSIRDIVILHGNSFVERNKSTTGADASVRCVNFRCQVLVACANVTLNDQRMAHARTL